MAPSEGRAVWMRDVLVPALTRAPERHARFTTVSGRPIDVAYGPDGAGAVLPRRVNPRRGPWTMRTQVGGGTCEEVNARYRALVAAGATGLHVAMDPPTLAGRDPDHPRAAGTVGCGGVSIATVDDLERLFDGIDVVEVPPLLAVSASAPMVLALFLVFAERRGLDWDRLGGTLQNDVLGTCLSRQPQVCPPGPALRLASDVLRFCVAHLPRWETVLAGGYDIRRAGATAGQELATTLCNALEYVSCTVADDPPSGPSVACVSLGFSVEHDFFEEIAKLLAARRVWARLLTDRWGADTTGPRGMRCHARTSATGASVDEPDANVVRTAFQALAAVLGGADAVETCPRDAEPGPPTIESAILALRTQQVIAEEVGVATAADPLGGSWFLESLTAELEAEALDYCARVNDRGGIVAAVEAGEPPWETGQIVATGPIRASSDDVAVRMGQVERVGQARRARDGSRVIRALDGLRREAEGSGDTMSALLACARADATVGEMSGALQDVWGSPEQPASI